MKSYFCENKGCIEEASPSSGLCYKHTAKPAAPQLKENYPPIPKAHDILQTAAQHMEERAATYDQQGGERSISKTVEMFNTLTEHGLTEEQGWLFMVCLKMVRAQQGRYRADSYEDGAAYFALAGESAAEVRI